MIIIDRAISMATEHMDRCKVFAEEFNRPLNETAYYEWECILSALRSQQKRTYPCDLCGYGPPSSMNGKPCTMCPAVPKHDQERNGPLTLDELRQMVGQPVYVTHRDGTGGRWGIVNLYTAGLCADVQSGMAYWFKDYTGTIAYRRKPEEGTT